MNLIIEPGTEKDINEMSLLYDTINDYLARTTNYPGWLKGVYPTEQEAIKGIEEHSLFVARYGDKIIGSIILNHEPENGYHPVTWELELDYSNVYVIHTLVVHPDYHSSGIGNALINFAKQYAISNQIRSLRLDVYEKNLPAIKLYEKCGFQYIDTVDLGYGCYGLDWFRLYEYVLPI